jgi:hypothetical protein
MRLTTRGIVYHPEQTPHLTDTFCFSVEGVEAQEFVHALLDDLVPGQEVSLPDPTADCGLYARRTASGYQTKRICHGSFTDPWHDATRQQVTAWLLPGAEYMISFNLAAGWLYWYPGDAVA